MDIIKNRLNREEIERGVFSVENESLTSFFGKKFEAFVLKELIFNLLPSSQKIGKWWHKEEEIDIVALNEDSKEIVFFECKWSILRKKETEKIFFELKRKASLVKWQNPDRKELYGVIAKTIEGKETFREKGYFAFDFEDLIDVPGIAAFE